MPARILAPRLALLLAATAAASAVLRPEARAQQKPADWRAAAKGEAPADAPAATDRAVRVSSGNGVLPHKHGQVWREYDIRPYTSTVTSTARPEQAVIDWILRETGTEIWFSEPLGILSATHDTLRVYHTPEMQRLVADIVHRFVASGAESHVIALQLMTVGSPNWRSRAHAWLRPVEVQTPGIEAWLLSKENAAVLLAELSKRTDYREQISPNFLIPNGQSRTISRMRPRNYVRDVLVRKNAWPGYELQMGQVDEGFSLQISPLFSSDGATIDAVIKCYIDQVERLVPVPIDLPLQAGTSQRVQVQVPQMASWRLHERFRWPANEVLLLSCGVVASPTSDRPAPFGIPNPFHLGPSRADALLFIESKGKASQTLIQPAQTANGAPASYRGRY